MSFAVSYTPNFVLENTSFTLSGGTDFGGAGIASPHNVFIEATCYTGIVGLTIFIVFLSRIILNAINRRRFLNELLPIAIMVGPILGLLLSGQIFEQKLIWCLFAYIAGGENIVKQDSRKNPAKKCTHYHGIHQDHAH